MNITGKHDEDKHAEDRHTLKAKPEEAKPEEKAPPKSVFDGTVQQLMPIGDSGEGVRALLHDIAAKVRTAKDKDALADDIDNRARDLAFAALTNTPGRTQSA